MEKTLFRVKNAWVSGGFKQKSFILCHDERDGGIIGTLSLNIDDEGCLVIEHGLVIVDSL